MDIRCRLTLYSVVWDYRTLYSALILSYHFALRQVNRPPAYRKPSERSWDSLSRPSGPTYKLQLSFVRSRVRSHVRSLVGSAKVQRVPQSRYYSSKSSASFFASRLRSIREGRQILGQFDPPVSVCRSVYDRAFVLRAALSPRPRLLSPSLID